MSGIIVPYAANYLKRRAVSAAFSNRNVKRARLAYGMARKYGPHALRAGRRIYRAYKKYRSGRNKVKQRYRVGESRGTGTTKRRAQYEDAAGVNKATRTLFSESLLEGVGQTNSNDINERQRGMIYVSGFKYMCTISNTNDQPLVVNLALISPKYEQSVSTTDFFRANEGANRSKNFDTTLTSQELMWGPINPDKYNIHWRKRFSLTPQRGSTSGFVAESGKSYTTFTKWFKIGRQIRYSGSGSNTLDGRDMFLVNWADNINEASGRSPEANSYNHQERMIMYFREPK